MTKRPGRKIRASTWLLLVIAMVAVPCWWLLIDTDRSDATPKPIHIAELRTLAAIIPGRHPTAVTYAVLARRMTIGDFFAAGIGLKRRPLAIVAWSLPVPDKGPIMIDPGAPPAEASVGQFADFDQAMQRRIGAAARVASLILYTQGHQQELARAIYHLGKAGTGIVGPTTRQSAPPGSYTTAQAVAPGVVVIPASSHVPGARLIYVQLADGQEFLFAGNIATLTENWLRLRARSHLAAEWGPVQDRAETYSWLRTIRQLRIEAPKMQVVPGHDYAWLIRQRTAGTIAELEPGPAPRTPKPRAR